MNTIIINGIEIKVEGNSVNITGDKIMVGGKVIKEDLSGIIKIEWKGDLANLDAGGSVQCGNVRGDVNAGGSVTSLDVGGNIDAGGAVISGSVGGSVDAGGSVIIR